MENGKWKMENGEAERSAHFPFSIFHFPSLLLCLSIWLTGCSSNKHPTTRPMDPQEAALRDPFGYRPDTGKPADISGGDIGHYDRKAMRKDIDDVLNP